MTISPSEEFIRAKLREAIESAPSSDGYAEIDLTAEITFEMRGGVDPIASTR